MATIINGVFCSLPEGYGLQFNCTGPGCGVVGNLSIIQCITAGNVLSCQSRSGSCTGVNSNFTDSFTLMDSAGQLSAVDLINVNGKELTTDSNYTVESPYSRNATAASTTGGGNPQSSSTSTAQRWITPLSSPVYFLICWLAAFLSLPGVATASLTIPPQSSIPSNITSTEPDFSQQGLLATRTDAAKIARLLFSLPSVADALYASAADVVAADASSIGHAFNKSTLGPSFVDTLRNNFLPTGANAAYEAVTGQPEEAAKDLINFAGKNALKAAIIAAAPETAGSSLLLLLVTHVVVDIAVDELFKGGHVLVEFAQDAIEGHGATDPPGACDVGNYLASPWFYRQNQFGTDEWRDCQSCCVEWQKASEILGCGCCMFEWQYADPSNKCCSKPYYSQCCRVDCGLVK